MEAHLPTNRADLNRRRVVLGGSALLSTAVLAGVAGAAEAGLGPAAEFLAATRKFLTGLEPGERKAVAVEVSTSPAPLPGGEWPQAMAMSVIK